MFSPEIHILDIVSHASKAKSTASAPAVQTRRHSNMPRIATKMAFQVLETGHMKHKGADSQLDLPSNSSARHNNELHLPTVSEAQYHLERERRLSESSGSVSSSSSQEDSYHASSKTGSYSLLASMLSRRALARAQRKQ